METIEKVLLLFERFGWSNVILCFLGFGLYRIGVAAFGNNGWASDLCAHIKREITEVRNDHKAFVVGALETSKKTSVELARLQDGSRSHTEFMLILCDAFESIVKGTENESDMLPHIQKAREALKQKEG